MYMEESDRPKWSYGGLKEILLTEVIPLKAERTFENVLSTSLRITPLMTAS